MPTYAAIIYNADVDWTLPEHGDVTKEYMAFGEAAAAVIRGGAALYPTSTATSVQVKGGKGGDVVTTDGPYAETKEYLGGLTIVDVDDKEQARVWAGKIAIACGWPQEVREVK